MVPPLLSPLLSAVSLSSLGGATDYRSTRPMPHPGRDNTYSISQHIALLRSSSCSRITLANTLDRLVRAVPCGSWIVSRSLLFDDLTMHSWRCNVRILLDLEILDNLYQRLRQWEEIVVLFWLRVVQNFSPQEDKAWRWIGLNKAW